MNSNIKNISFKINDLVLYIILILFIGYLFYPYITSIRVPTNIITVPTKEGITNIKDVNYYEEDNENYKSDFLSFEINKDGPIPRTIYQTWKSKDMPDEIKNVIDQLKKDNPEFKHVLYDDNGMRDFISNNFEKEVVEAYDKLIPGAYRADLWRYCVLYKNGGVYMDIKIRPINDFKFKKLTDTGKEYFTKDLDYSGSGIYNGLMICKANNPILKKAIDDVVKNVKNNFYGTSMLEPTGPLLMKKYFTEDEVQNMDLFLNVEYTLLRGGSYNVVHNIKHKEWDKPILEWDVSSYNKQKSLSPHYSVLWQQRAIYK